MLDNLRLGAYDYIRKPPEIDYLLASLNRAIQVRQLRLKVETEPSRPRYIITEPGIGYVFRGNVITQEL